MSHEWTLFNKQKQGIRDKWEVGRNEKQNVNTWGGNRSCWPLGQEELFNVVWGQNDG